MTDLRDLIARVIFRGQWKDPENEFAKHQWVQFKELYLADADAVLAVLADPPVEVVERAARALFEDPISSGSYTWAEMVQEDESRAELWRDDACRILKAVFGGEQE